jgi:hypothetical protein
VSPRFGKEPKRERDASRLCRLVGTSGAAAAVGEALESQNGFVCWELDPAYCTWFWPFMDKAAKLVLLIPEGDLEPIESGDCLTAPRVPTKAEKDAVLKLSEDANKVRVYSLVLRGRQPSVHKAFPTRTINIEALRYCREQVSTASEAVSVSG